MVKLFKCIIDDGKNVYKVFLPAKTKKELMNVWGGNGEFEKIEDVTADFRIDVDFLRNVLQKNGYGEAEERLICYLVENNQ